MATNLAAAAEIPSRTDYDIKRKNPKFNFGSTEFLFFDHSDLRKIYGFSRFPALTTLIAARPRKGVNEQEGSRKLTEEKNN